MNDGVPTQEEVATLRSEIFSQHRLEMPIAQQFPAVHLAVREHDLIVSLRMEKLRPDSFEVELESDVLTVRGKSQKTKGREPFCFSLRLPFPVEQDNFKTRLDSGVLSVRFQRVTQPEG